ncbi:MAG: hypothetical protein RIQ93_551 [Verrucomicrobiota bacterium]|jgi:dihydroorotate dehydrogenase (fumarate)
MNLASDYLGLELRNPFIVGASPLCDEVSNARRLEDAGAAAVVMRSVFTEQFDPPLPSRRAFAPDWQSQTLEAGSEHAEYQVSPHQYLRQVTRLKAALSIPVIGSLNGHQHGAWTEFAVRLESAGADAIELNFYQVVADPSIDADRVETEMLEMVGSVAGAVKIPVAVKLSPFHSAVAQLAVALELAGAAGVVIFNRFYQPDVNTEDLAVQPVLRLSDPQELLLRLRWLAILSPQLRGSLAVTGGVHTADGAIKALLTGADAVQLVSAVLAHGPRVIASLIEGLQAWMEAHGFAHVAEFRGALNLRRARDPAAFERANYIRSLQSWKA